MADHRKAWELFDLSEDRSETKNLAAKYPEKVKAMEQAWEKHAAENHALALQDPPQAQPGKSRKAKAKKESVD